jgi:molybdate transport system permease protein
VIAQLFVAMPFLVLTVESGFTRSAGTVEEAARTLGASPWYVFTRVTLPATQPAIVAGAVLTWARALGEFGATITFAGNFPGTTRTLPIATYLALESDINDALLISMVMVVISVVILVALRGRWVGAIGGMR